MKLERITYLFHTSELNAMLMLTGGSAIPFWQPPTSVDVKAGIASLQQACLAESNGDVVVLDRISAFLASAVGRCIGCVCLSTAEWYYGILLADGICVLMMLRKNRWMLTPFQTLEEALEAFEQDLPEMQNSVYLGTKYQQETSFSLCEAETAQRKALEAAQHLRKLERPTKGRSTTWKQ